MDDHFIWADSSLGLTMVGLPEYILSDDDNMVPEHASFSPYSNLASDWLKLPKGRSYWIRMIINNRNDTVTNVVLRARYYPARLKVSYQQQPGVWENFEMGIMVSEKFDLTTYYPACPLKLNPGKNIIYLYNYEPARSFALLYIDFVRLQDMKFDRLNLISSKEFTIFFLFSFFMFLIFQTGYLIIQLLFHKRPEYREYIFYLLGLIIYFGVRLEIFLDYSMITWDMPWLRRFLNDLMLLLPVLFYFRFARYFVDMNSKYPGLNSVVRKAEWVVLSLAVLFTVLYVFDLRSEAAMLIRLSFVPQFLFSVWLIYALYRKKDDQIRYLLYGSLIVTISHTLAMGFSYSLKSMLSLDIQDPILFTMVGIIMEIFFFNTGLGYKAKVAQEEKVKAQQNLIYQMEENQKITARMQTMRNKIASDLHDDVGSTLSSIGLYSEVGSKHVQSNPEFAKGIFEKIYLSTQRMMSAMNDIVWAVQSFGDTGESFSERLKRSANERLQPAQIDFTIHADPEVDLLQLTIESRRNLLFLFKEAINNAAKYSGTKRVELTLAIRNGMLNMTVEDFGIGFQPGQHPAGHGLITMEKRATELGGTINMDSIPGRGTRIFVAVPVHDNVIKTV